jgi:mRNA-degrading endonuclease RelE of RelBE toxin-antitoxin system
MPYPSLMRAVVVETETYRARAARLLSEAEREELRAHLAERPTAHDVIPGLGGLRKARWGQPSRNKGKRGGVRVIYFYALSAHLVALLDVYSKEEKGDLSHADKKRLRAALEAVKRSVSKT